MTVEDTSDPDAATSVDSLDHDRPDEAADRELAAALRDAVRRRVRLDADAQAPYATEGSVYGARPTEVAFPRDDDVRAPGASRRSQLGDGPGASNPSHPVEKLAEAVA